ncbi:MAG: hypothetical protein M3N28_11510 [Actinomycetota bacterium]|nr:hypothetical protein [Actinomycetota bacterium]
MPPVVAVLATATLGVLVLAILAGTLTSSEDAAAQRRLLGWTLAAFAVHLALGLAIRKAGVTALAAPDASYYDETARAIVDHWTRDFPLPELPSGKEGFFYLLAALYWLFGPSPEAGLVVNAVMAAAVVPVMADVTRRLLGGSAARFLPPLLVLLPGFLIWSSQLLREAGVLFLIAVAANCAVRLTERLAPGPLVVLAAALAVLFTFRGNVALLMTGGLVVGVALGKRELLSGLSIGVSTLSVVLVLVLGLGLGHAGYKISVEADLRQVETVRSDLSQSAESGFASEADVSTTGKALAYLPVGFTNFLLGPFPWQIRSARQLIALPDLLVWWFLLPSLWRGLWSATRLMGRRLLTLLVPALMTGAALGLLIGNFGTVVRERPQVVILLLPVIAHGLALRRAPHAPPATMAGAVGTNQPGPSLHGRVGLPLPAGGGQLRPTP